MSEEKVCPSRQNDARGRRVFGAILASALVLAVLAFAAGTNNGKVTLEETNTKDVQQIGHQAQSLATEHSVDANGALSAAKSSFAKHEEQANVMVPWVHWPGHPHTGGGDKFAASRKQSLLQILSEQFVDKSAQVMPLKELVERQLVDAALAKGTVSDYQLAEADKKSAHHHMARSSSDSSLSCNPFC